MPKLKKEADKWAAWKGLVLEAKDRLGLTDEDIAAKLVTPGIKRKPPSRQTVSKWRQNPDAMPMWAFARINRILDIRVEDARAAAVVWR